MCVCVCVSRRRDLSRVVLVDNNPLSFLHQPANGVPCQPFRGDPDDRHLSSVLLPLLQSLALFPDVRPILEARFKLHDWFAQRGLLPPAPPAPVVDAPMPVLPRRFSAPCGGGAAPCGARGVVAGRSSEESSCSTATSVMTATVTTVTSTLQSQLSVSSATCTLRRATHM